MGRVTLTEILTGDTASAANVNATMTSWNTQSASINGANVRESGIWRQAIGARAVTPSDGRGTFGQVGPSAALAAVGVDTLFTVGNPVKVGAINNAAAADQVIVRFSTMATISTYGDTLQVVLAYSTDDVTYTVIEVTRRYLSLNTLVRTEMVPAGNISPSGSLTIAHVFSTTNSATLYFRPMYQLSGAATVTFDNTRMMAQVYTG